MANRVWLSLGSNILNPVVQIKLAIRSLSKIPMTKFIASSSYYRSKPLGQPNQPYFINAVVSLETKLSPETFLDQIQKIEISQGRIRDDKNRFGPRSIDLDIILYNNKVINSKRLIIPHYDVYNREFVLYPLFEINPEIIFPDGTTLYTLINKVPINNLSLYKKN